MNSTDSSTETDPESQPESSASPKSGSRTVSRYLTILFVVMLVVAGIWWIHDAGLLRRAGREPAPPGDVSAPDQAQARQAENQYQLGLAAAELGDADEAMLRFAEAVHLSPNHLQAHAALGALLQQRGHYQEATEHLRRDLEINPHSHRSHYYLGLCYSKQAELAAAIEHYRLALQYAPQFVPARYNLGLALTLLARNDEAVEEFERVLEIASTMEASPARTGLVAKTQMSLADALIRRGKLEEASVHVEEALRADPNLGGAYALRGEIASAQHRLEAARQDFQKALELNPQDERTRGLLEALRSSVAARQKRAEQRQGESQQQVIARLEEQVGQEPDNADLRSDLGMMLARTGQYARAREHLEEALRLSPAHYQAHVNLAAVYLAEGEFDQAERYYRLVVQIDPSSVDTHRYLAKFLYQRGQFAEAVEAAGRGLEHQPDNPLLLQELAWMLSTCPQESLRDGPEAVSYALKLKELWEGAGSPPRRGSKVWDVLAAAQAEVGRFEEAVAAAEQALALADKAQSKRQVGEIEARLGLYRQGRAYRETPPALSGSLPEEDAD